MNVHYEYIDRLKGLAIILVVMGHVLLYCCCSCDFPRAMADFIGKGIYSFHMPLFMFLSGIVVSDFPHASKLRRKLPQWLVPCVVIGLIYTFTIGDSPVFLFCATQDRFYGQLDTVLSRRVIF